MDDPFIKVKAGRHRSGMRRCCFKKKASTEMMTSLAATTPNCINVIHNHLVLCFIRLEIHAIGIESKLLHSYYILRIGGGKHFKNPNATGYVQYKDMELRSFGALLHSALEWQKRPNQETGLGNRGCLKVLNAINLVLNDH